LDPTPLASFLAGSVLTALLPLGLLLAVSLWYWLDSKRIPGADSAMRGPAIEEPEAATGTEAAGAAPEEPDAGR
jgi:hypothetical protein